MLLLPTPMLPLVLLLLPLLRSTQPSFGRRSPVHLRSPGGFVRERKIGDGVGQSWLEPRHKNGRAQTGRQYHLRPLPVRHHDAAVDPRLAVDTVNALPADERMSSGRMECGETSEAKTHLSHSQQWNNLTLHFQSHLHSQVPVSYPPPSRVAHSGRPDDIAGLSWPQRQSEACTHTQTGGGRKRGRRGK